MKKKTKKILANMLGLSALAGGAYAGAYGLNKYYENNEEWKAEISAKNYEVWKKWDEKCEAEYKELLEALNSGKLDQSSKDSHSDDVSEDAHSNDISGNAHSDDDVMER